MYASNILIRILCLTSYLFLFYSAVFSLEQNPRIAFDHIKQMAIVTSMLMHPFFPFVLHQDHQHYNAEGKPGSFQARKD